MSVLAEIDSRPACAEGPVQLGEKRTTGCNLHAEIHPPLSKKQKRKLSKELQRQETGRMKERISQVIP
jgi:hypothetical protein